MKNCGNCQFWTGPRKLTPSRDGAVVEHDTVKGECAGGKKNRQQMSAMGTCLNGWIKWPAMK